MVGMEGGTVLRIKRTKGTKWTEVLRDAAREFWRKRWFVLGGAVWFALLYWVMRLLERIGG